VTSEQIDRMMAAAIATLIVIAFVIAHRFRDGIFLGRDGAWRCFPMLYAAKADAESSLSALPLLAQDDWRIASVTVTDDEAPQQA
jgi:hypothetical protein